MPPTSDLNPVARVLESLLVRAWCLSDELKYDEVSTKTQTPLRIASGGANKLLSGLPHLQQASSRATYRPAP
jgi:hypothetical protein